MTEHKDIQNPKDFSDKNYQEFRYKLMDDYTSSEELKEICMTLAHLPTQKARDILDEFQNSNRAKEVEWLEFAVEENNFFLLSPNNDQEKRDFLAVRLLGEIQERIIDMEGKIEGRQIDIIKDNIRLDALEKLSKENETKYEIIAIQNMIQMDLNKIEDYQNNILLEEKIMGKIKESIKTEQYQNINPWKIREIHLDGEGL